MNRLKLTLLVALAGLGSTVQASATTQQSADSVAVTGSIAPDELARAPVMKLSALDLAKLAAEDGRADAKPGPYRIARAVVGDWSADRVGSWASTPQGERWTLAIDAANAVHLNFGFKRFALPSGAQLRIVSPDGKLQLGPYGRSDQLAHGQLWTPLMPGARAILVLDVPTGQRNQVIVELRQIGQGYRGFGFNNSQEKSGACNMDTTCLGAGDLWNAPRRSVARLLIGGSGLCSGMLINNTSGNRRLLLGTASHCKIVAANGGSVVAYFNYETATCRTPGSSASGTPIPPPSSTLSSLAWRASTSTPFNDPAFPPSGPVDQRSDWTLIELTASATIASLNLHLAGWNRDAAAATCAAPGSPSGTTGLCASIHHPNGDEKRITFSEANLVTGNISTATGAHWRVAWDPTPPILPNIPAPVPLTLTPGVTEPGSSGSPLFDAQRRVVGVLSGGPSVCGATGGNLADLYGKLSTSFNGTPVTGSPTIGSLLDPGTTGAITLLGIDFNQSGDDAIFQNGFEP